MFNVSGRGRSTFPQIGVGNCWPWQDICRVVEGILLWSSQSHWTCSLEEAEFREEEAIRQLSNSAAAAPPWRWMKISKILSRLWMLCCPNQHTLVTLHRQQGQYLWSGRLFLKRGTKGCVPRKGSRIVDNVKSGCLQIFPLHFTDDIVLMGSLDTYSSLWKGLQCEAIGMRISIWGHGSYPDKGSLSTLGQWGNTPPWTR